MSSKLRLNELPYDSDGMEDKLFIEDQEPRPKNMAPRTKRKKQDFEDYNAARSIKRRSTEHERF